MATLGQAWRELSATNCGGRLCDVFHGAPCPCLKAVLGARLGTESASNRPRVGNPTRLGSARRFNVTPLEVGLIVSLVGVALVLVASWWL